MNPQMKSGDNTHDPPLELRRSPATMNVQQEEEEEEEEDTSSHQ
jgi:hypothetical protein